MNSSFHSIEKSLKLTHTSHGSAAKLIRLDVSHRGTGNRQISSAEVGGKGDIGLAPVSLVRDMSRVASNLVML